MSALLGTRLGPYEILAPIGAGGMGEVYRARDTRLGREVAIKVLPPQLLDSPEALARFEREARAVAALNHPNLLALHDIGREGHISYAVTELLEGETVRARIASGPVPPRRALEILTQVARGLGAAHERGIVHRDIKPENLFLTNDGQVKILDFGVAVRAGEPVDTAEITKAALTEPGMLVGTPAYMAPEQLLAQNATPRSDMFAFGLVAHELLTGKHPFSRATFGETTIAVLRDEPTPLSPTIAASLPPGAALLLTRCLEKQPGDRPTSARDLALYLDTLATAPVAMSGSQAVSADAESIVRRRVLLGSIVLLLLTVLLTWGYARWMADRAVTGAIENDLARADRLVRRVQDDRFTRLALTARLLASIPGLNALFAGTDPSTVNDFLLSYQASHPGTPTLIALTKEGQLLARTDRPAAEGDPAIQKLAAASGGTAMMLIDGRPHHVAVEAASAGDTSFGYIAVAVLVDGDFAQSLREATQDEIVLLSNTVIVSTLRGSQMPWKSIQEWRQQGGRQDRSMEVEIGAQRVVAREVSLSTDPMISAIVAKSRDEVAAPFRRIQSGLIAIGALCAAVAVAGAFWMARNVTRAILPSGRHRR